MTHNITLRLGIVLKKSGEFLGEGKRDQRKTERRKENSRNRVEQGKKSCSSPFLARQRMVFGRSAFSRRHRCVASGVLAGWIRRSASPALRPPPGHGGEEGVFLKPAGRSPWVWRCEGQGSLPDIAFVRGVAPWEARTPGTESPLVARPAGRRRSASGYARVGVLEKRASVFPGEKEAFHGMLHETRLRVFRGSHTSAMSRDCRNRCRPAAGGRFRYRGRTLGR